MENEAAYRQLLVQGVLAVLLPTEDLENDCLTALVGQIFSEMILGGGIGGKASEPWMIWEGITKISEVLQAQLPKSKAQVRVERSNSDVLNSTPRNLTGRNTKGWRIKRSLQRSFWLVLQYCFVAFSAVRFFVITFATSSSLPSRIPPTMKVTGSTSSKDHMEQPELANTDDIWVGRTDQTKQPIVKMKIWSCAANLLDLDARMPWLGATFSLLQHVALTGPGKLGNTDGMIDK
jgi:PXA domain